MYVYMYICIYVYMHTGVCMYVYISLQRLERSPIRCSGPKVCRQTRLFLRKSWESPLSGVQKIKPAIVGHVNGRGKTRKRGTNKRKETKKERNGRDRARKKGKR